MTVAVDGPSGSGKSSVSRAVARARGFAYLDTGAMYRAVTAGVLRDGHDPSDGVAVAAAAPSYRLEVGTDPDDPTITLDGVDVRVAIRSPEVTAAVSAVSTVREVRDLLIAHQRAAVAAAGREGRGIVLEGRDIGTVVLPEADVKVFLVADPEVRAARRAAEDDARNGTQTSPGQAATLVRSQLERRDAADSGRAVSPLRAADDAVTVDASELELDEVVAAVLALVDAAARA